MTAEVTIWNLALARLGDAADVSDRDEGSVQASHCARFYPIARDTLLARHPWGFATRAATLAQAAGAPGQWAYAYRLPADCMRVLTVANGSAYEMASDPAGRLLLTQAAQARVRYIARVEDANAYPPQFVDALSWLLASHLAGPLLKSREGAQMAQACLQHYERAFREAQLVDACEEHATMPHPNASFIEARWQ